MGTAAARSVRFLLDLFRAQGLQICSWEDFLRKTSGDALCTEAAIALTQAVTVRTASILLDQQQGALARSFEAIQAALAQGDAAVAQQGLMQLSRYVEVGQRLTRPWRVAVLGAPNVGKSSLVNALTGYQRSVVAPTPGTTRDVVTTRLALDGWLIELADTAGMRTEAEALEEQGIRRARATAASADLCLWVLDASAPPVWPDADLGTIQPVINKIDLTPAWDLKGAEDAVRISAQTGEGLADLCATLVHRLVPDPPLRGAAVPFTPRLYRGIAEAQHLLARGDVERTRQMVTALRENRWLEDGQ